MKIRKLITVFVIAIFFVFLVPNLSILKADSDLGIKHFTFNCYGIFDTTPANYAELYDMTGADSAANVVAGIAQVKAINPDFKDLLYWNMRAVDNVSWMKEEWDACVANNWFLRDNGGNMVHADFGYLVDVGNPSFQAWIANWLNAEINSLSYGGLYADNNLFWGAADAFWGCYATPINPRTGTTWSDAQMRDALIDYHTAVKNALGSKLYVINGIVTGYRFYDHQSAYQEILSASPIDGFVSESLWHPYVHSNPCIWMSETRWQKAVQFLIWVQDNWLAGHSNRIYVPVCKLAYGNQNPTSIPSGATREQVATYAYTSVLLGVKTGQAAQIYFSTSATGVTFDSKMQPLYNAQIGTPTNDCYMIDGTHVYARDFSNGKVLVNPTDSSYRVNLGLTKFVNAATGQLVPQTITIPPHTGGVLTVATGVHAVTIKAACLTQPAWTSVPITMDGLATGYSTSYTFTVSGTHTFTVPATDAHGHPFLTWDTGSTSRTITVSGAGTHVACYQGEASIDVWTNKASYSVGEMMSVYLRFVNPGAAMNVRVIIKLELPGGGVYGPIVDVVGPLAAGVDATVLWDSFPVQSGVGPGTYTWIVELRNPYFPTVLIDSDEWAWTRT